MEINDIKTFEDYDRASKILHISIELRKKILYQKGYSRSTASRMAYEYFQEEIEQQGKAFQKLYPFGKF